MPDGLIPDPSRPGKYIRVQAPMRIGKPVTQSNTAWTTGAPWAYSVSSNAANLAASALNRLAPGWNPTVYSAGYMGGNPWRGYTTPPAPQQPRPPTPVTQTPAPPYAYTPPPAWISSLYPNTAPQAAEPTPTATPQAPTYAPVGSFERQTQLQNWFDWAAKQGKRPGWYGGAPGEGAYPTNLGDVLEGEQNWYYDPNYGNFIKNTGGSGAFGGKGNVKNNQYGADFQRRINEAWGKVGPEMEKLRRKRRMGQLPGGKNKNQPQQSSGKVAPAWVGGIGSFNV